MPVERDRAVLSDSPNGPRITVAGVILAGGQATRMGGGDKCLLHLDGRSLLDRID